MVKAILRTKSIGTKVTEEEYARLDELAAAAGQTRAEWVRTILIEQLERRVAKVTEEAVLAELLGLRTILLNLLFTVAKGETMTAEQMQAVIERADAGKLERARKLLAAHVAAAPAEIPTDMKVQ
ncbi:MAG: ribbon-helix-helix protein, CopG family [Bryobacteraceae bacterium]|jgi:DNA-binding GntR family transcriptional regulator